MSLVVFGEESLVHQSQDIVLQEEEHLAVMIFQQVTRTLGGLGETLKSWLRFNVEDGLRVPVRPSPKSFSLVTGQVQNVRLDPQT